MTQETQTGLRNSLEGWERVGRRFKGKGTYDHLWPINVDV